MLRAVPTATSDANDAVCDGYEQGYYEDYIHLNIYELRCNYNKAHPSLV